ncbi:MAG: hypothetical protein IPO92_03370 [Saprospiraceae bacterium]|nr:hypothetical protein [Saprospiraceae bacterium]
MVSRDGGATWPDTVQINAELPNNPPTATPTDRKRVALVGYKNTTQVRFKFEYVGNYYYWAIDDVVLINEAKADVKVNENFYAAAPSLVVPSSQVSEMAFLADVSNVGNGNATNVKLDVVITDPANGNAELVKLTNDYGNLTAGAVQENKPFAETWTPPNVVGTYNGAYVITATEDVSGTNNTGAFSFQVSENTYANLLSEDQVTPANYLGYVLDPWAVGDEVTYYSAGNIYHIKNGANLTVDKVRFGIRNDIANVSETGFINVDVYEWVDEDGSNECSPFERVKVGTNAIFLDGNVIENARNIELPIWALDAEGNANEGVRG